ncbi:hypothetical protein Bca4012_055321 [Brassica carinata]
MQEAVLLAFFLIFVPFLALAQMDTYEFSPRFNCVARGGNFTANSSFAGNLNSLVSSLSSLTSKPYGFYNLSSGDDSSGERAYATGLCRREVKRDDCLRCIQTAAQNLTEQCPQTKQAVVWDEFKRLQLELLDRLKRVAAAGGSNRKYAQGNGSASTGYRRFYGMAQCTPDLSEQDCNDCLELGYDNIPSCCDSLIGLRWFCPSCNFRFETWRFYEFEAELEPDPPARTERTGKGNGGSKVIIAIVIPTVLVILFAICVCLALKWKKNKSRDRVKVLENSPFSGSNAENDDSDLCSKVWRSWREEVTVRVIDPSLTTGSRNDILRCIHVGLLCVQESAASRPTMALVALMLNSSSFTLPTPSRPAFVIPSNDSSSIEVTQMSLNDVTVSELSLR